VFLILTRLAPQLNKRFRNPAKSTHGAHRVACSKLVHATWGRHHTRQHTSPDADGSSRKPSYTGQTSHTVRSGPPETRESQKNRIMFRCVYQNKTPDKTARVYTTQQRNGSSKDMTWGHKHREHQNMIHGMRYTTKHRNPRRGRKNWSCPRIRASLVRCSVTPTPRPPHRL